MVWLSCWFIPMALVVVAFRVIESIFGERISFAFKRTFFIKFRLDAKNVRHQNWGERRRRNSRGGRFLTRSQSSKPRVDLRKRLAESWVKVSKRMKNLNKWKLESKFSSFNVWNSFWFLFFFYLCRI